jgi:hypothetical protein
MTWWQPRTEATNRTFWALSGSLHTLAYQPDLRAEIERLRGRQRPATRPVPDRQRATDASLHQRLQVATDRIRQLETDNHRLRRALAAALGERRANPRRDTPKQ